MRENEGRVARAAQSFPDTFGLRAFPGETFQIDLRASYIGDGDVVTLYTARLMPDGKWASFAKGTVEELRQEIVAVPDAGKDSSTDVSHVLAPKDMLAIAMALVDIHRPDPAPPAKPKDLIDEQACAELRFLLLNRMGWIDRIYPHGQENCSTERTAALTALIHLTNQLGFECEGFLWEPDADAKPILSWTSVDTSHS